MKFGKWITAKDLYLVTIKELIKREYDTKNSKTNYIMLKKREYAICKKKNEYYYYDVLTNKRYKPISVTENGTHGISNATPLKYEKTFISLEELSNKLKEIQEQEKKLSEINNTNIKKETPNSKKLLPFPKKY